MQNRDIVDLSIKIEKLHRYVFDNIYVQRSEVSPDDLVILNEYKNLYEQCPNFRAVLYDEHQEKNNLESINFNRYGFK